MKISGIRRRHEERQRSRQDYLFHFITIILSALPRGLLCRLFEPTTGNLIEPYWL
jgi:hypothetical protein